MINDILSNLNVQNAIHIGLWLSVLNVTSLISFNILKQFVLTSITLLTTIVLLLFPSLRGSNESDKTR